LKVPRARGVADTTKVRAGASPRYRGRQGSNRDRHRLSRIIVQAGIFDGLIPQTERLMAALEARGRTAIDCEWFTELKRLSVRSSAQ